MSQVRWLSPSPLWDDLLRRPAGFRAPTLLRFGGDDFIPQYQGVLETDPSALAGYVARPETWREPAVGLDAETKPSQGALRLYQPVHGRFYLAAASLACRVPGLPEHTVDVANGDEVAFVVRRVTVSVNAATKVETETGEWAWVKREDGSAGWVRAAGQALAADEERHPMFGTTYTGTGSLKGSMQRRVFAGLIPASRREAYVNAPELAADTPAPAAGSLDDPRVIEFQRVVMDPWVEMKEWYDDQKADDVRRVQALQSAESSSAYLLLDFYDWVKGNLAPLGEAIDGARTVGSIPTAQQTLYNELDAVGVTTAGATQRATLISAMKHAASKRAGLEALAGTTTRTPSGYVARVLTGDPRDPDTPPSSPPAQPATDEATLVNLVLTRVSPPFELVEGGVSIGVRRLKKLVMDALAAVPLTAPVEPEQLPARAPQAAGDDWFAVRCVYLRPRCGRKAAPVVSERSERFRLTSFFDPDAPARHLRVALPVDTSPATLRKYNRNVAFVLSDQLRRQMSRAADMKKLIDGEVGNEDSSLNFAVICSFSIPIITICALILLMIIVSLLNIIFWWLPLFKICFPVPKPK